MNEQDTCRRWLDLSPCFVTFNSCLAYSSDTYPQVVILPGVEIGQGCTIAASSVVTKSIPAWSVAMGQPAKVVKKVTPLDPVEKKA